jgi:GTP-dependent phosphoenolpyruvate carboxykinase
VDIPAWREELAGIKSYFAKLGPRLPEELNQEVARLEERLAQGKAAA